MATETQTTQERAPLSRERVIAAAVELADTHGIKAVSMRRVGHQLGVEAMSLYNHVANKEDLLDGMVEQIVNDIDLSPTGPGWKSALRSRILAARSTMLQHKWAPAVMETRTTIGPGVMRYANSLLEIFRRGGFSYDLAHHALHALGSRSFGFSQELFEPDDDAEPSPDTEQMMMQMADELPYIIEMMAAITHDGPEDTIGWCDDQTEFVFALDLILDGLERHLQAG